MVLLAGVGVLVGTNTGGTDLVTTASDDPQTEQLESTSTVAAAVSDAELDALDAALVADTSDVGSSEEMATLLDLAAGLVDVPDPARPSYERDRFAEGADLDGDCRSTRHEVLAVEAQPGSVVWSGDGCTVVSGLWYDTFTGSWVDDPGSLQLDHVVALGDAWRSGAWAWTDADRERFANDLGNLNVILGEENQAKADLGPASYRPTNPDQSCAYLLQYTSTKIRWNLSVTADDWTALSDGLQACDTVAAAPVPPAPDAPTTTTSGATTTSPPTTTTSTTTTTTTTVPPPPPPTSPPTTPAPVPVVPFVPPAPAPQPFVGGPGSGCDPNYSGCVPIDSDVDCAGGSGNGPSYASGPVQVIGSDIYGLDADDDGVGCE